MTDYEKLGVFYLGRTYDLATARPQDELVLYDSRDLLTHAVCVGMTGSGKTGLCLALIEEALLDGIPVLAIDPKGDLGNLALTFPNLAPSDFLPWIDAEQARREGTTPEVLAGKTAARWRAGLEASGQPLERIARLREAGPVAIFTPGSEAGLPLGVLRSFAAPGPALAGDAEAWRNRVESAVSGLLALVGVAADPLRSREHVLLSQLVDRAWHDGRDADLETLVREVQRPPLERVGAFDLESFYSAKERMQLALALNTLLAAPSFAAWSQGEPLDIARLLHTPEGRPRICVLSIAHLSDAERTFFTTLLLQEVVAWMRAQTGTTSLRALLFIDEVMGLLPPTANPPTKKPLLTLLKQARAYGLGVVLATQNPVDIDYKALSNAGTWLLGRLQTERDKARVLDGLEGVSAGRTFDRAGLEAALGALGNRVFLMSNVHEDAPVVFQSRHALCYLAGPMSRAQIRTLMAPRAAAAAAPAGAAQQGAAAAGTAAARPVAVCAAPPAAALRPAAPAGLEELFLPAGAAAVRYAPALGGTARVHYAQARPKLDHWAELAVLAPLDGAGPGAWWERAEPLEAASLAASSTQPAAGAGFGPLPGALDAKQAGRLESELEAWIARTRTLVLHESPGTGLVSRPGESEGEFRVRAGEALREQRDAALQKVRAKHAPRVARLRQRLAAAADRIEREQAQVRGHTAQAAISLGATLVGALFGRKLASASNVGRAATAARGAARAVREREDVARAETSADELSQELAALEVELEAEVAAIGAAAAASLAPVEIRPRKADIAVVRVALVWVPQA